MRKIPSGRGWSFKEITTKGLAFVPRWRKKKNRIPAKPLFISHTPDQRDRLVFCLGNEALPHKCQHERIPEGKSLLF
ncbi:hypothetical protein CEE35_05795 [Candidatus Aerophobetes bacterium Ae_b3b]|nr:MAG: hypothetical protein CEE35_05795 [Candidatus Aerophobetes bacterium Ae_b3b]